MSEFLRWNDSRIGVWNSNPFIWSDVALVEEIISAGAGNVINILNYANKLPKKKKLQLIRIILTLQHKDFIENKYKTNTPISIHIDDIKFLLENRNSINVIAEIKK